MSNKAENNRSLQMPVLVWRNQLFHLPENPQIMTLKIIYWKDSGSISFETMSCIYKTAWFHKQENEKSNFE